MGNALKLNGGRKKLIALWTTKNKQLFKSSLKFQKKVHQKNNWIILYWGWCVRVSLGALAQASCEVDWDEDVAHATSGMRRKQILLLHDTTINSFLLPKSNACEISERICYRGIESSNILYKPDIQKTIFRETILHAKQTHWVHSYRMHTTEQLSSQTSLSHCSWRWSHLSERNRLSMRICFLLPSHTRALFLSSL